MNGWRWKREWLRLNESAEWRWLHKAAIAIALLVALVPHLVTPAHAQHREPAVGDATITISYAIDGSSTINVDRWFESSTSWKELGANPLASLQESLDTCLVWDEPYLDEELFSFGLSCSPGTQSGGLAQQSVLNLSPLLAQLQDSGASVLDLTLQIPSSLPFHSLPASLQPSPESDSQDESSSHHFSSSINLKQLNLESTELAAFTIEYGFQWQDVQKMLLMLIVVVPIVPALTAVLSRRALRRMQQSNSKTIVFHFRYAHAYSALAIWIGWFVVVKEGQWDRLFELVSAPWPFWMQMIACFSGFTAIPAIVWLLCRWIAYPVIAQVGRVKPSLKYSLLTGAIEQSSMAVLIASGIVLFSLADGHFRLSIVWLLGIAISVVALKAAQARVTGMIPQSITVGPLRDRVFGLASNAGVEIKQLYVLPTRKAPMANAFAISGGTVVLTDYLLENLSKREVDAVIAHELAHFKCKHHASRTAIVVLVVMLTGFVIALIPPNLPPLLVMGTIWLVPVGTQMYLYRRQEFEADCGAAKLTGEPEAMISALAAISELAEMPAMWHPLAELLGTHPSLQNRANAIAKAYQIPAERVEQLLDTTDSNQEKYAIPNSSIPLSYSTKAKSVIAIKAIVAISCTTAAVSVGTVLVCRNALALPGYISIAVASLAAFIALMSLNVCISQWGMSEIGTQLRQKFQQQGFGIGEQDGVMAGFSPSLQPRLYEGSLFWDMGLLQLSSDRLAYVGEQTQFSLPVNAVRYVGATKLRFEWFRSMLIQIQWDNPNGEIESGYLAIREGNTEISLKRGNRQWLERLQMWQQGINSEPHLPEQLQALPPPAIGDVTSTSVKMLQSSLKLTWLTILPATALLSIGLGLSASSGFYACLSAGLAYRLLLLPTTLFTDPEAVASTPSEPPLPGQASDATPEMAGAGDLESV